MRGIIHYPNPPPTPRPIELANQGRGIIILPLFRQLYHLRSLTSSAVEYVIA
jgi:hypothetical protein